MLLYDLLANNYRSIWDYALCSLTDSYDPAICDASQNMVVCT